MAASSLANAAIAFFAILDVRTKRTARRPAVALGIADRIWSIGDLLDAALATQPIDPVVTAPDRRRALTVIEGGKN